MSVSLTPPEALERIPFINVDGQDVPSCGVMQVTGSTVEDGVVFLTCAQPGGSLVTEYAVNGLARVRPGDKGVCYRQGDLPVAFEGGSPLAGEGWGVRADQWTLARGYPSIARVHGVRDAANQILLGRIGHPASVMGVCASDLDALTGGLPGVGSVAVFVWNGTSFVPAEPAMSFTGYNASPTAIKAGTLAQFVVADGLWVATTAAGGTTTVVKVYNETADETTCLWPGKRVAPADDIVDACENPFEDQDDCWLLVLNSSGGSWSDQTLTLVSGEHYLGKYVFSIEDVPVYAIRVASPGIRIFRANLSGTLLRADASGTVASVQSLDAAGPPEIATVSNLLHLAGLNGDDCFVVEDTSGESPVYYFLNIEHHDCP